MEMPGEKLVIKLWETVAEKGIGGLFRPWQMRREGRASLDLKREELLMMAQANKDAELIRRGESPLPSTHAQQGYNFESNFNIKLEQRAREISVSNEVRREVNVTKALLQAEQVLQEELQEAPETSVNDDWLFRWRDSASQFSSEEMQNLWGRVLAGEVKAPGAYSLRTLEFLKNVSQEEAREISKLSEFIVDGSIFRPPEGSSLYSELSFDFLMRMQHLGIIAGVEALGMIKTWGSQSPDRFTQALISNSKIIIVRADDPSLSFTIPSYMVTPLGEQVLSLGSPSENMQYLREIGSHIKAQGFDVTIAKFIRVSDDQIRYHDGISV